ncbi:MAG: hypothetical protein FRX49_11327 [Trebouxia sp. A1-2]|nr:MAG: hypothetical protein FRX49_11327 [Trebouxia sp. A1-2]
MDSASKRPARYLDGPGDAKKARSGFADNVLLQALSEAGCQGLDSHGPTEVEDPRVLKRALMHSLGNNTDYISTFLESVHEAFQDQGVLSCALMPINISGEDVPETGDSLIRLLLNISAIQTPLASFLLKQLPDLQHAMEVDSTDALPQLVLGSLRWLDEVVQPHELTETLLEVLPTCCRPVQQGILELLPELVVEQDCEMTDKHRALLVPVLEAISNLSSQEAGQAQVTDLVLQRFQSAETADLPALLRFLLQHVDSQNASQVVELLRSSMPSFAFSEQQAPGQAQTAEEDMEEAAVEAMRTGLQCSHLAADTVFSQIRSLTDPEQHVSIDLWLLLLLVGLGAKRSEAVHKLLRKKFTEGHVDNTWLDKAVIGHQGAVKGLFPGLLGLAGQLVQAGQAAPQAAGTHLYTLLFACCTPAGTAAQHRQEVLAGLHGHLGSGQAGEVSTALQVLLALTHSHAALLLDHANFMSALLDCLDNFTHAQLHQVFEVVSELVVFSSDSGVSQAEQNRQRLGRQLEDLLHKQMQSEEVQSQRVGIIGTIKLVERLAHSSPTPTAHSAALDQRSKEAEQLLARSFGAKQHKPAMFALLCDELTNAVTSGCLAEPIRAWLSLAATEELEAFLDDCSHDLPAVQLKGNKSVAGGSWMNLNGNAGQVMLPLLRILASPDQLHRQSLAYLCAITRLALTLEFHTLGNLDGLSAILGCPLHMPHIDLMQSEAVLGLSPEQQSLNLSQLEALLAHVLVLLPSSPCLHLTAGPHTTAQAQTKSQKRGKAKEAKKSKGAPSEEPSEPAEDQENVGNNAEMSVELHKAPAGHSHLPLSRLPEVQGQLRPLDAHVLRLLGQVQATALPQAALAPAAFLLEQLQVQLVEALTRTRRPAFLNSAASQDASAGAHLTPQQIWGGLQSVLPALPTLLTMCNSRQSGPAHTQGWEGVSQVGKGEEVVAARVEGASQDPTPNLLITGHPIATAALAPIPAAARQAACATVMQHGLHCIQQLTAADWLKQPEHRVLLHAFLRAFGKDATSSQDSHQAPSVTARAMKSYEAGLSAQHKTWALSKGPLGPLEQEVALLHIQANLISIAETIPGTSSTRDDLCQAKERISRAADEALQQGSESQPQESSCSPPEAQGADPATRGGGGWKGQQGVIGDLVHLWVAWSPQPCQTMLRLLHGALAQVPSQPLTGKKAQEPVVPYPGLSGSSLHVWYKALSQELLLQWATYATGVVALHKGRQGPLQQEAVDSALEQLRQCGKAFSSLLLLNKAHLKRIQMHAQALRFGSKLIQHCLRTLPFWEAWYTAHPNQVEPFSKAMKEVQSATRILYVICAEGKANKNITIANLVVGTKHVLEEFRVGVTAVMLAAKQHILQGNLKHKDLTGQEVSSQVPFTQILSDDDEDDNEQQDRRQEAGSDTE